MAGGCYVETSSRLSLRALLCGVDILVTMRVPSKKLVHALQLHHVYFIHFLSLFNIFLLRDVTGRGGSWLGKESIQPFLWTFMF